MSKYNEIMERLTVSDETRERLIDGAVHAEQNKSKILPITLVKRIAAVAACFILIVALVLVVKNLRGAPGVAGDTPAGDDTTPLAGGVVDPIDKTPWGTVLYRSAAELSEASGIEIKDLENVPFEVKETSYQDYENNLVEITYSNGGESLSYRVSKGDEDNSGDYNEYTNVYQKDIGGTGYTLKGEGDLIYCVLYRQGEYSYSLTSTGGLTLEQLEKIH